MAASHIMERFQEKLMATPPYFQPASEESVAQWLSHGLRMPQRGEHTMTAVEREMLEAWAKLSSKGEIIDLSDLHEAITEQTGKKRALTTTQRRVYIACNSLADAGIAWRERANNVLGTGHRRALIYTLRAPGEVASSWKGASDESQDNPELLSKQQREEGARISKAAEQTYEHLKAIGWINASGVVQGAPKKAADDAWTLHLISQLIERCSKSNPRERIDTLQSHIWLNGEMIEVEAARVHYQWESGAEYGLISAEDSQLILAIITMAMQTIARELKGGKKTPENKISFDLLELSRELHPAGGRSGYRAFQRGMARIINTAYRINRVGEKGRRRLTFRLLNDVLEGEGSPISCDNADWTPSDAGMRYFSFSLNSHIWNGLLRRQGWLVHPELVYERSGLIHRVYHHLRTHAHTDTTYEVEATDLAKWLVSGHGSNPTRSRLRFREELKEQLVSRAQRTRPLLSSVVGPSSFSETSPSKEPGIITLNLFDLNVRLRPCPEEPSNFFIEAKQSKQTLELMRRQEALHLEMLENSTDLMLAGEEGMLVDW